MKRNRTGWWLAIFLLNYPLFSQNLDLLTIHAAGKYRSLASAGIGVVDSLSNFDLNPANLAFARSVALAASQSFRHYTYSLLRVNSSSGSGVLDIPWNDSRFTFEHLLVTAPIHKNVGVGFGCFQKLKPFLKNSARAITGSSLINQLTNGGVYALTAAAGIKLSKSFSVGIALARYEGDVTSKFRGDNHGSETNKSAKLQSDLSGNHAQIGVIFNTSKFNVGVVWESTTKLKVATQRELSADSAYKSFFPNYTQTQWKLPMIIRGGLAYKGLKNYLIAIDFERHQYDESNVQLNLYEFGQPPNWRKIDIFRIGIEGLLSRSLNLPLRLGYARIPQLYASTTASSTLNSSVLISRDTQQNIFHLLTIGTTIALPKIQLHTGVEYKTLNWHRDVQTTVKISDNYSERIFAWFAELVCILK